MEEGLKHDCRIRGTNNLILEKVPRMKSEKKCGVAERIPFLNREVGTLRGLRAKDKGGHIRKRPEVLHRSGFFGPRSGWGGITPSEKRRDSSSKPIYSKRNMRSWTTKN